MGILSGANGHMERNSGDDWVVSLQKCKGGGESEGL